MELKKLLNPSKKDVQFNWDSVPYIVKAESFDIFPEYVCRVGAKRIADREWRDTLNRKGKMDFANSLVVDIKATPSDVIKEIAPTPEMDKTVPTVEFPDLEKKRIGRPKGSKNKI